MLAYIFWHRPYPITERERYEQAIVHFQNDLAGQLKPPGFIRRDVVSEIEADCPGSSDLPGYMKIGTLLDGTQAMDPLNAACHIRPRSGAPRAA